MGDNPIKFQDNPLKTVGGVRRFQDHPLKTVGAVRRFQDHPLKTVGGVVFTRIAMNSNTISLNAMAQKE